MGGELSVFITEIPLVVLQELESVLKPFSDANHMTYYISVVNECNIVTYDEESFQKYVTQLNESMDKIKRGLKAAAKHSAFRTKAESDLLKLNQKLNDLIENTKAVLKQLNSSLPENL